MCQLHEEIVSKAFAEPFGREYLLDDRPAVAFLEQGRHAFSDWLGRLLGWASRDVSQVAPVEHPRRAVGHVVGGPVVDEGGRRLTGPDSLQHRWRHRVDQPGFVYAMLS